MGLSGYSGWLGHTIDQEIFTVKTLSPIALVAKNYELLLQPAWEVKFLKISEAKIS